MSERVKHIKSLATSAKQGADRLVAQILLSLYADKGSPVIIAVGGPGGTGKSTFCEKLARVLPDADVLPLDDYKFSRRHRRQRNLYGAHPKANRFDLLLTHLSALRDGLAVERPVYERATGEANSTVGFAPRRFVILDGEIATYHHLRARIDFSIFIDSDWKTQLATRINRDVEGRGYSSEKAIATFLHSNLKEFGAFGAESKTWADVHLYCHDDYHLDIEAVTEDVFNKCRHILHTTHSVITFEGLVSAVPTPFDAGNLIDEKALVLHLEYLHKQGVSRILVNGTTGEFFSLTPEERSMLLRIARYCFPGVIIFGVGCEGLKETLQHVSWAGKYGADAVAILPPYYFSTLSEHGLREYFTYITANTDIPIFLYNFPKHVGYALQPSLIRAIRHAGLKDSSGDTALIAATSSYFTGVDTRILDSLHKGGRGFVSGTSSSLPSPYVNMEEAFQSGNTCAMEKWQGTISRADSVLGGCANIPKIKYAISRALSGYPERVRLPLLALTKEERQTIDTFLDQAEGMT